MRRPMAAGRCCRWMTMAPADAMADRGPRLADPKTLSTAEAAVSTRGCCDYSKKRAHDPVPVPMMLNAD